MASEGTGVRTQAVFLAPSSHLPTALSLVVHFNMGLGSKLLHHFATSCFLVIPNARKFQCQEPRVQSSKGSIPREGPCSSNCTSIGQPALAVGKHLHRMLSLRKKWHAELAETESAGGHRFPSAVMSPQGCRSHHNGFH